jgi:acetyl esterase/lipase
MGVCASVPAFLAAGMSLLYFVRVRSATGVVLWMPKVLAESAAAVVSLIGALGAILGLLYRRPLALAAGVLGAGLSARYVLRVSAPHDGFERVFGPDWQGRIAPQQRKHMLKRRWVGRLPEHAEVRWTRDIPYWAFPADAARNGKRRELLCDIWQPPEGIRSSGLAFLYCHGGAWHWMDKDFGTRPLFRHLAAQGHVVMDVAYRLCPEVDIYGMLGDIKRAIVWMKANAETYGVDPARVVVAGGSSGGHLALLAAYSSSHPVLENKDPGFSLTPEDIAEADTSARAVVAYYATADMRAVYRHFDATFGSLMHGVEPGEGGLLFKITGAVSGWVMRDAAETAETPGFSFDGMMGNLLGGTPEEVPEVYASASPITHAGPASPPTLLLQGEHDAFLPACVTRALHHKLVAAGVPSVYVEFPQTEHGFDLALPRYAPAAHAALYDVERFLALMV